MSVSVSRTAAHAPPTTAILLPGVSGSTSLFLSITIESAAKSRASARCSEDVAFVAYSSSWQEPGDNRFLIQKPGHGRRRAHDSGDVRI